MSDATDREAARDLLTEQLQPSIAPVLLNHEIDEILDRNQRASTWAVDTDYAYGAIVLPPIRNGWRYRAIGAGTSALVDPGTTFWPTVALSQFSEGESDPPLLWVVDGLEYANVYDVRRATYEGWRLKAMKASQFANGRLDKIYERCVEMANRFRGVSVT